MIHRIFCLCGFLIFSSISFAQQQLEIIQLQYQSAERVLPHIKPFVEPGGTASGMGYQLFIRSSPQNLKQIREVIAAIDKMPRRLVITVRHDNDHDASGSGVEFSGSVGNDNVRITQPRSRDAHGSTIEIRRGDTLSRSLIRSTRGSASDRISQQLQVMEGGQAVIRIGQSLPVPLRQVVSTPAGVIISDTTVYKDIGTGFYAAPSVSGDRVTLEISPIHDTAGSQGSINVQRLSTTVSGRLGEWIELGGSSADQSGQESGVTRYSTRSSLDKRRILLKVEEIH